MEGARNEGARRLTKAVVEALQALGPSVSSIVFHYLKAEAGVEEDELHKKPEALVEVIRKIFGPLSSFIEDWVSKYVSIKLNIKVPLSLEQILSLASRGAWAPPVERSNGRQEAPDQSR